MPKIRRNHRPLGSAAGYFIKLFVIAFGLLCGAYLLYQQMNVSTESHAISYDDFSERYYLPDDSHGTVYHKKRYSLNYSEKTEQGRWVAYYLTNEMLTGDRIARPSEFQYDKAISSKTANHKDYTRSGFDRGHLVPAADMQYDAVALNETFLMSNISPQRRAFNGGIWRELEENVRSWVKDRGALYIITGSVISDNAISIGNSTKIKVPEAFYKILLDLESQKAEAIGFLIPNKLSIESLNNYAVTIDSIESITQIDFFSDLVEEEVEHQFESEIEIEKWKWSKKKYQIRLEYWNNR